MPERTDRSQGTDPLTNPLDDRSRVRSTSAVVRLGLVAIVLVLLAGLVRQSPLVLTVSGVVPTDVVLHFPAGYLALAPVSAGLDALSLLTVRQHLVLLATIFLVFTMVRVRAHRRRRSGLVRELASWLGFALVVAGVYSTGVLAPRPMAALRALDPELVIVDFHSHTDRSHDGRGGFDLDANRAWLSGAGFDLAWVTDHRRTNEPVPPAPENPLPLGEGTALLPGYEVVYRDEHVAVLDTVIPDEDSDLPWPVLIQTLPEDLSRVPVPFEGDRGGVVAIEWVDGDPRALAQAETEREKLEALTDSLRLTPVSSSNLHGWARAAAAWNVLRVPGWRAMTPEALGARIVDELRARTARLELVERRRLKDERASAWTVALTAPRLLLHIVRGLSWAERLAWIVWIGLLTGALALTRAGQSARPAADEVRS